MAGGIGAYRHRATRPYTCIPWYPKDRYAFPLVFPYPIVVGAREGRGIENEPTNYQYTLPYIGIFLECNHKTLGPYYIYTSLSMGVTGNE